MRVTMIERAPGVWRLRIENGKTQGGERAFSYKTVHGDEEAAKRRRFEILHSHEEGTFAAPDKVTVQQFFDRWLKARLALEKIRRSSAENYETVFRLYIAPKIGSKRIQKVTGPDIQAIYTGLALEPASSGRKLKMSSLAHVNRVVATLFRAARKSKIIKVNPMEEVETPKTPKNKPKAQPQAVVSALLEAIAGHWLLFPATVLGLSGGLRRGEVLGIRWGDLELDAGKLHVRGQIVQYRDGSLEWGAPKSEKGLRTITLPAEAVLMLRDMKAKAMRDRLALGIRGDFDAAYVFTEDGVTPIKPHNLTRQFKYHCRRLGLPENFSFHGTRHTHLTVLLRKVGKAGAKAVSERAGHSDIAITLRNYDTVFDEDDAALAELASGIIGKGKTK